MNKIFSGRLKRSASFFLFLLLILTALFPIRSEAASLSYFYTDYYSMWNKVDTDYKATEGQTIRVGWYESPLFQEGMSDDVGKSGYSYEYLQRISDYTSWDYEYVYGEWSELINMLKDGKIDILAGVSETDERKRSMLFPEFEMGRESYYLYQPQDTPHP